MQSALRTTHRHTHTQQCAERSRGEPPHTIHASDRRRETATVFIAQWGAVASADSVLRSFAADAPRRRAGRGTPRAQSAGVATASTNGASAKRFRASQEALQCVQPPGVHHVQQQGAIWAILRLRQCVFVCGCVLCLCVCGCWRRCCV